MSQDWVDRLAGKSSVEAPTSTIEELAITAARAAEDKLGHDTMILAVGDVLAITDYFVITHGMNDRQVRAIVDDIQRRELDEHNAKPVRVEGMDHLKWVLLDFGSFVVHVFDEETRRYYELERLWRDVPRLDWH